jgi:hypothetical protein
MSWQSLNNCHSITKSVTRVETRDMNRSQYLFSSGIAFESRVAENLKRREKKRKEKKGLFAE